MKIQWDKLNTFSVKELEEFIELISKKLGAMEAELAFLRNQKLTEKKHLMERWNRVIPETKRVMINKYKKQLVKLNEEVKNRK